jgi:hypothetical protein
MPGQTYLLGIGVNAYESDAVRPLSYAVADVTDFREWARTALDVADERCRLLTSPAADARRCDGHWLMAGVATDRAGAQASAGGSFADGARASSAIDREA